MSTIPVSTIVNVNPSVIGAGGNALSIIGLMLTNNPRIPLGTVQGFTSQPAVAAYFGGSSNEALSVAKPYFNGFTGATISPGSILFTQYNSSAVGAWIRGGPIGGLTLAQLQALNGTLNLNIDGYARTGAINLNGANSFSAAAATIQTALNTGLATLATIQGSIAGGTLTVTQVVSGTLAVGQQVQGTNVALATNTVITGQLTGLAGGTGTYSVSVSQVIGAEQMTTLPANVAVTYDSIATAFQINSGAVGTASTIAFATGTLGSQLLLTQATGALLSQGAAAATPAAFMQNLINNLTQNWVTFMTCFDPDFGVGNTQKLAFSQWTAGTNNRYAFVCWDTDPNPTLSTNAATSLGQLIAAAGYSGTCLIWDPVNLQSIAAFICGAAASINFNAPNGRITFAFRNQSGLQAAVSNALVSSNLLANFYNGFGVYGSANQNFFWFYPGSVSGPYLFLDSYINQIWLSNQFQLTLASLLGNINAIPYNQPGYRTIENALATPIQQGLTFGAYAAGVQLSSAQQQEVNAVAGANISPTLFQQGWYLQVLDPGATVRNARGTPVINFFYCDGEAVQQIQMASIEVQ